MRRRFLQEEKKKQHNFNFLTTVFFIPHEIGAPEIKLVSFYHTMNNQTDLCSVSCLLSRRKNQRIRKHLLEEGNGKFIQT